MSAGTARAAPFGLSFLDFVSMRGGGQNLKNAGIGQLLHAWILAVIGINNTP